jgi:hypothetical protein
MRNTFQIPEYYISYIFRLKTGTDMKTTLQSILIFPMKISNWDDSFYLFDDYWDFCNFHCQTL